MSIEIDPEKLRKIAKEAIIKRELDKKKKEQEKIAAEKERIAAEEQNAIRIKQLVEDIFASIPKNLEKAAKKPREIKQGIKIVARIPIVREHMTSTMDTKGHLSKDDAAILTAAKEKLATVNPSDLYTLEIKTHSEQHQYYTKSRNDWSEPGPCIHYSLIVTATLPK